MFEWLDEELRQIKTRKFHLVDGPAAPELKRAVETSDLPLPSSYKEFVLRFGNAKLYRVGTAYRVTMFAGPRAAEFRDETFAQFGRTYISRAYFKLAPLNADHESPVYESGVALRRTANGFEEWITKKCRAARKKFGQKKWAAILDGPEPFTEEELAVVEARRQFRWRVIGITENGDLQFEIHNGSDIILPYLSIGVRARGGGLEGGARLRVSHIRPGETAVVEEDWYKEFLAPQDVETFEELEPGPEDREIYWEFRDE